MECYLTVTCASFSFLDKKHPDSEKRFHFEGHGLAPGDSAKWVSADAGSCDALGQA